MASRFLVVDDEHDIEILIKQKFTSKIKSREIEFTFARNGNEALEKISGEVEFDLCSRI
ncbi:MAG: hypothetical protein WCZ90_11995 [Melioribacteraceae bacterium]